MKLIKGWSDWYDVDLTGESLMLSKKARKNRLATIRQLPMSASTRILKEGREISLFYFDIGCSRGHLLPANQESTENGVVLQNAAGNNHDELTMENSSSASARLTGGSEMLHDLDDVYTWYRQMVEMT